MKGVWKDCHKVGRSWADMFLFGGIRNLKSKVQQNGQSCHENNCVSGSNSSLSRHIPTTIKLPTSTPRPAKLERFAATGFERWELWVRNLNIQRPRSLQPQVLRSSTPTVSLQVVYSHSHRFCVIMFICIMLYAH